MGNYEPVTKRELDQWAAPRTNAVDWQDQIIAVWGSRGATKLGIYNRRVIRGGSTWSTHAVGRGIDIGGPTDVLREIAMHLTAAATAGLAPELGEIIYDHRRWTGQDGTRRYSGSDAHLTHVHFSLTVAGAERKTDKATNMRRICSAMFP